MLITGKIIILIYKTFLIIYMSNLLILSSQAVGGLKAS